MPRTSSKTAKPSKPATGADALVAQLEAIGVEVVFGIPGVHNLAIFDSLSRSKTIRTIVVRHEQTAGYAADGYARASGRLGVCVTTTGPGAANTAAAMGEARMARSPVLHISTQLDVRSLEGRSGRFQLHESPDQLELMRSVTRWAGRVQREDAIAQMVLRAAKEAFNGRRGPAFLEIPFDLLAAEVREPKVHAASLYRRLAPIGGPIARAADRLQRSKAPIVWAGGGVISSDASEELVAVSEMLDAPVITTYNGKGAMPPKHPLSLNLPPHQPEVTDLLQSSDAILVVGSDLDGMSTQGWRIPMPRPRVGINVVGEDARRNYACDILIEADAKLSLSALYDELAPDDRNGRQRTSDARKKANASLKRKKESKDPITFVETVRAAIPDDAFVCADMTIAGYWSAAYMTTPHPRSFAYPLGWGTLGFAFPASIGAALSGRRTIVIAGDAGFQFGSSELATAMQEKLPITVIVVSDSGYGMLRFDQKERFGKLFAVDVEAPDFVKLSTAFGVKARKVTMKDLSAGIAWSLKMKGPSLLALEASWAPPLTTSPRWPLKGRPELRP